MSDDTAKSTRVRLDPDQRRDQILQAALEAFHAQGYGQTSVRDLADAVGMSIAGLYHHFASKDDILLTILETAVERLLEQLQAACDAGETPEGRLRAMIENNIPLVVDSPAEFRIMLDMFDRLPSERRDIVRERQREAARIVRAQLEQLKAEGRLKDVDLNVATFMLNGMVNWLYFWYDPRGDVSIEDLADQIAEIFFHGVLKP